MNRLEQFINRIRHNSNIKNGLFFTVFAFLNNGINFLLLVTLANYLAIEEYGQLNLFTTSITIFSALIPLGTIGFVGISFFRKAKDELKDIINIVFLISFISLITIAITLFFCGDILYNVLGFSYLYQIIALLICFFQVFNLVNLEIWRLEENPIKYGVFSLGIALLNFGLTYLFILSFKMDWGGRVYGQLLATFIFFFTSIVILIRKKYLIVRKIDITLFKETLSFGVPLIPHQITSWLRQGIDRYIINYFVGNAVVGLFSFAFNFSNVIHMVGIAFNASNSVFIYKNLSDKSNTTRLKLYKQTYLMTFIFFIITVIVCLIAFLFIPIVFPKYTESLPFVIPLCLGAFFQCVYYLFVNYLFYYKKTKQLMYITISISILHFILSFLFTRYSCLYTAYISLFSNFVICLLVIIYSQKIYSLKIKE